MPNDTTCSAKPRYAHPNHDCAYRCRMPDRRHLFDLNLGMQPMGINKNPDRWRDTGLGCWLPGL